jgi:hypothetical protein
MATEMVGVQVSDRGSVAFCTVSPCERCGTMAMHGDQTPWALRAATIRNGVAILKQIAFEAANQWGFKLTRYNKYIVTEETPEQYPLDNGDFCCGACYDPEMDE